MMRSLNEISDVMVVDMHHWGAKTLTLNGIYRLQYELNNKADPSAVSVREDDEPYTGDTESIFVQGLD